mgnify:CR=1 FL=1
MTSSAPKTTFPFVSSYGNVLTAIAGLIAAARTAAARPVNCVMSATDWLVGTRMVELEQGGGDSRPVRERVVEAAFVRPFLTFWPGIRH